MIPYFPNYYNTHPYFQMNQNYYDPSWIYPFNSYIPDTTDFPFASEILGSGSYDKNDVSNVLTSSYYTLNGFNSENKEPKLKI